MTGIVAIPYLLLTGLGIVLSGSRQQQVPGIQGVFFTRPKNENCSRKQYTAGVPAEQIRLFTPDTWTLDWALMSRPGNVEIQFDLFTHFRTNVQLYPAFQQFYRKYRPSALVIWGRHDAYFDVADAECYTRDLPAAEVHVLDAGHKALETHCAEITELIRDFLARKLASA